jgi:hypothetical protein
MSPGETFNALRQEGNSEADSTKIVTDLIEEAQQWSDQLEANGYDVEQVLADEFGITVDDSGRVEFDFEDFDEYDDLDEPSTGNERLDRMIEVHETDQAYEALKDTLPPSRRGLPWMASATTRIST